MYRLVSGGEGGRGEVWGGGFGRQERGRGFAGHIGIGQIAGERKSLGGKISCVNPSKPGNYVIFFKTCRGAFFI